MGLCSLGAVIAAFLGLALTGCAAAPESPWVSPLGRDHPLAGRILELSSGQFVPEADLRTALREADFILLGEKHDNRDHHRLRAAIVRDLVAAGRRPAVAFEMIGREMEPKLAAHLAQSPKDGAGIGAAVDWSRQGWLEWEAYLPIAQAALDAGLPVHSANLPLDKLRPLAREGLGAVSAEEAKRLGIDRPLDSLTEGTMIQEIVKSHCNQIPDHVAKRMVITQRARDGSMARALLDSLGPKAATAVLIAGNGHIRNDRGVPAMLAEFAPTKKTVAVGFMEVHDEAADPKIYAQGYGAPVLPFDYVWFTPRVDDNDPCETFAEQLKKRRN